MTTLLNKRQAAELIGVHPETLARLARAGNFPRPIRLTPSNQGRVRWDAADIERWIEERKAEAAREPVSTPKG